MTVEDFKFEITNPQENYQVSEKNLIFPLTQNWLQLIFFISFSN